MNAYEENYKKLVRESQKTKYENRFRHLCAGLGLPLAQEQFRFHPVRLWQFDFAWPEYRVAVEIEGGIWRKGGGAHSHPLNIERDVEKYNAATLLGWRLFRFTDKMLKSTTLLTGSGAQLMQSIFGNQKQGERNDDNTGGVHSENTGVGFGGPAGRNANRGA